MQLENLADDIASLTLREAAELARVLRDELGSFFDLASRVDSRARAPKQYLILDHAGPSPASVVKLLRKRLGLTTKEARGVISCPGIVLTSGRGAALWYFKSDLERLGALVILAEAAVSRGKER